MGFVHESVLSALEAHPTIRSATRTATPLRFRWVNHASYVLSARDVRLMTDPWLFGSAFNNGWDLISETKFSLDDFREITHIWFSHEHPDHFAPPVLKAIEPAVRANITVLFQETNDHKVLDFCDALGFKVQELRNHRWHALRSWSPTPLARSSTTRGRGTCASCASPLSVLGTSRQMAPLPWAP